MLTYCKCGAQLDTATYQCNADVFRMLTCGMMFFSSASLNNGVGGSSKPISMKGTLSTTSSAAVAALLLPVPASVVTSSSPWKVEVIMLCFLGLPPAQQIRQEHI